MAPDPVARIPAEPGLADLCRVWPGSADLCLVWPGPVDEAIDHLQARGVEIEDGPVRRNGAGGIGTSVYFRDPDGSLLEFISYAPGA